MRTLLLICTALAAVPAQADRPMSLDQAVSEARERYPGRVLSAETERRNGHDRHRIRILTDDGRVKRLDIDPESGRRMQRPPQR
ncbi:MAG: PepSY domain-containing protein [Gammaproteobacteria bacterium]|nr:PepSY domain-containing protein [Gammaproteobacteria bacterium]